VKASTTYRYLYDQGGQRTAYYDGIATTTFPSDYYDVRGATTTKHIYAGDELVATIEGNGTATSTYTTHLDHLGGTNVVTNASGTLAQTLAYYPFGVSRVDEKMGGFDSNRKYDGYIADAGTGLYYLQARYDNPTTGRFVSQDPSFLDLGDQSFKQMYGQPLQIFLANPQQLNSYSYTNNNPINLKDPDGRCPMCVVALGLLLWDQLLNPTIDADGSPEQIQALEMQYGMDDVLPIGAVERQETRAVSYFADAMRIRNASNLGRNGARLADGSIGFKSHEAFKRVYGSAGTGREWHHIVEQNPTNIAKFGPERINNTNNYVNISTDLHRKISAYYSSNIAGPGTPTVREWLSTKSYEQQSSYGRSVLQKVQEQTAKE
jgi:RHS repeat-associated protein